MKKEELRKVVIDCINETLTDEFNQPMQDEEIKDTDSLRNDLAFDSLDIVDFTIRVEKRLNISIPDEKMQDIDNGTVASVVDYLETIVK